MLVDLLVAYSGHNQGDISLDLDGEVEHKGDKGRPGCYLDITVDLEVQEVSAFEYMELLVVQVTDISILQVHLLSKMVSTHVYLSGFVRFIYKKFTLVLGS